MAYLADLTFEATADTIEGCWKLAAEKAREQMRGLMDSKAVTGRKPKAYISRFSYEEDADAHLLEVPGDELLVMHTIKFHIYIHAY